MEELERIKLKIREGKPVVGTNIVLSDSSVTEIFGRIGYDFVWIDLEHAPNDRQELKLHMIAASAAGVAPFVRIPWNDPVLVKPVLELGPAAVIFPMIRSAEEAVRAVRSCLYPPEGIRGYGPVRAIDYGLKDRKEYLGEAARIWKIMQIEHVDAVENLESILAVEGVDSIVAGPMDLAASVGMLHEPGHQVVQRLMDRMAEVAVKSHVPLGTSIGYDLQSIRRWIDRGASWFGVGSDVAFLVRTGQEVLRTVREAISEKAGP